MSTGAAQLPEAVAGQSGLNVAEDSAWKAKILLVDDNPENLVALEAVLESPDHDLVKANSGIEALRYLLEDDFAAIEAEMARIVQQAVSPARLPGSPARQPKMRAN